MNAIIAFALRLRALMVALFVLVMIGGVTAFVRLNIEAYPDPVPPLVDIVTQNPGQSAERSSVTSPFRSKWTWLSPRTSLPCVRSPSLAFPT